MTQQFLGAGLIIVGILGLCDVVLCQNRGGMTWQDIRFHGVLLIAGVLIALFMVYGGG